MGTETDLFERFGGTRPMARALRMAPSTVDGWKQSRRIPAEHQPHVLRKATELEIDVSAEDVIWPFPEDRGRA